MENVCKTYFSTGRTPAQNPRAVFSINQLAVKYEHASRDGSLFPEKWGLSHQPSPLLCCAWCTSRAFSPGSTGMCQYVLCSVLLGDELSSPHCPTSKNVIFFFLSYISPHVSYTTPATPLPSSICLQGQLDGSRTHGLCKTQWAASCTRYVFT